MKFFIALFTTLMTVAASATSMDLFLIDYTYGQPTENSRSANYIETQLRVSQMGMLFISQVEVMGPMTGTRKTLVEKMIRLNPMVAERLINMSKEFRNAEVRKEHSLITCKMRPLPGTTIDDLKLRRDNIHILSLISNSTGCFMNTKVQPKDKKLFHLALEMKRDLRDLAEAYLSEDTGPGSEKLMAYEFAQDIMTHNVLAGTYNRFNVKIDIAGLMLVSKIKISPMIGGKNIILDQDSRALPASLFKRIQLFNDKMQTADLEEFTNPVVCEKLALFSDMIDDLFIYETTEKVLVDTASDCTVAHQVHPADFKLQQEAAELKKLIRRQALNLLGL